MTTGAAEEAPRGPAPPAPRPSGARQWAAFLCMTGFGTGLMPRLPGTTATLAAVAILACGVQFGLPRLPWIAGFTAVASVVCVALGTWAEKFFGQKDPQRVVLDEFAGAGVAVFALPDGPYFSVWLAATLAFRFLDMVKPLGLKRLQALPAGWGILVDDLAAGAMANVLGWLTWWAARCLWPGQMA